MFWGALEATSWHVCAAPVDVYTVSIYSCPSAAALGGSRYDGSVNVSFLVYSYLRENEKGPWHLAEAPLACTDAELCS